MVYQTYTPPTCTLEVIAKGSSVLGKFRKARGQEFVLHLDDPRLPEEQHFTIKGDRSQLEALYEAVNSYVKDFLKYSPPKKELANLTDKRESAQFPITDSQSGIYLQPRSLLTHELFLGTLATEKTGQAIPLSVLHLFDLLVALEESQRDLIALPLAAEPEPTPEWLRSLALILITGGLTVLGIRLYDRYILANQEESNLANVGATDSKLDNLLSPAVTPPITPSPTVSPSPLTLPTPPTPGELPTVKPSPIDVPVLFPSPVPRPSSPTFSFPPPTPRPNAATPGGSGTNVVILPQIPPPVPPQRPIFPGPALPDSSVPLEPRPPVPAGPNIYPPAIPPGGYPRNVPQRSRNGVKPYIDVTRIPLNLPSDIALPALDDTNLAFIPKGRGDGDDEPDDSVKSDLTLFDKISQVAEVRKHFEETWEPPEDLDKNLQYNLLLNRDGSIKKVIPIGQASVDFYELTNMPFEDEPFVSGLEEGETATVRLVLRKNGKVQTFLESVN